MQITFLGTGTSQGIPVIACACEVCTSSDTHDNRLRTSVMVSHNDRNMVIDTGPDFRQQMLKSRVKSLDAVLFTHEHKDHIAGLDDVRAFNYLSGEKMDIYCSDLVESALRREFAYAFESPDYPGVPRLRIHRIGNSPFAAAGFAIQPVEVRHMNLPVFGFRIGGFAYVTDANHIADEEKSKLKDADLLVLNALRKQKHPSHFTLEEAIVLAKELGAKKTYFTHISHQLGKHLEVEKELPENMHLAHDGLILEC